MKSPADLDAATRERLFELAERRGMSRSALGKAVGRNHGYFQSVGELIYNRVLEALPHLGVTPRAFFEGVFVEPRIPPVAALLMERESLRRDPDPFLLAVETLIADLAGRSVVADMAAPSHRQVIDRLEDLRFLDHESARVELEELVRSLLQAPPGGGAIAKTALADAVAALTCWAAVRRMRGRRDVAGEALVVAFGLATRCRSCWAEGLCYKRGAFLMREYGRSDLALDWIDEARDRFDRAGEDRERRHLMGDRALVLVDLGEEEQALHTLHDALGQLPAGSFRHLVGVYEGLASLARKAGRAEEAREHFERALSCFSRPDYAYAHVLQGLGYFELSEGRVDHGTVTLRRVLTLFQQHGNIFDVALLALDLVPLIAALKNPSELPAFVGQLRGWLPALGRNRALRELINEVLALAELGRLTTPILDAARTKLRCQAGLPVES
jgi:tetratricopeptide (TPR) repeat protein